MVKQQPFIDLYFRNFLSINFIGLKIYNNNFKKKQKRKDQKGIARTGK